MSIRGHESRGKLPISLSPEEWTARPGQVIPSLDGARAVSVVIVLLGHLVLPARLVGVSALGLDIFFLISGFLITRLFFAEAKETGDVNLGLFYLRRLLRLYPVLVAYMGLVLVVLTIRGAPLDILQITSVFFYFLNYLMAHQEFNGISSSFPNGVLWSLSVEEHFYLFAPLAFVLLRGRPGAMIRFAIGVCLASLILRYVYVTVWPGIEKTLWIYRHSETRADSIAFGMLLASLCETQWGRNLIARLITRTGVVFAALVLLGSYAIRDPYFQNTLRFTIQGLALMPLLAAVVFGQPFRFANQLLNASPVRWVGRLSYSLYIWHGGVMFLFGWWLVTLTPAAEIPAHIALTFALAIVSYYVIEKPALRLRKYLHGSASQFITKKALPGRPSEPINVAP